ncbi:MAG: pyrroloquinoline quinone biosynthesis peptide chaperone PqqD [Alphaproteobacteria bacterium]|nr:pyrroloquinoline quinone biosynthesis peptide chaperone PqqD [Alphaproteobacteria bacterium]
MQSRYHIDPDARPALPPHVRLQFDGLRQKWVVLAPERVLWPDDVSLDILKLCDGTLTIDQIVERLAKDYGADRSQISTDVLEFLQDWADRRLLAGAA